MSHLVTIKAEVHDRLAAKKAAHRLRGDTTDLPPGRMSVRVPGVHGQLVADLATGELSLDSDNLHGAQTKAAVDKFLDYYAAELIKLTAAAQGQTVTETELPDGSIRLEVLELT